jgi:hypothetical protein
LKKTPMPYFLFEEQKVRSMNKKEMWKIVYLKLKLY